MISFMRNLKLLLVVLAIGGLNKQASATHIAGGDITYKSLNDTDYVITLTIYRDCSGAGIGNGSREVRLFHDPTCSPNPNSNFGTFYSWPYQSYFLPLTNTGGTEVSQLCSSVADSSACSPTVAKQKYPGLEKFVYQDTVTIPFKCDSWTVAHYFNARSSSMNVENPNGAFQDTTRVPPTSPRNGRPFYTYVKINNDYSFASGNSGPIFTTDPIPFFCKNIQSTYNYGVVDPDGDSLSFELVPGEYIQRKFPGVPSNCNNITCDTNKLNFRQAFLIYRSPEYTSTEPLHDAVINKFNGTLTFKQRIKGRYVVVIKITEYDKNNPDSVKGETYRDIQFQIDACDGNNLPALSSGGVFDVQGGVKTSNTSLKILKTSNLCFKTSFTDADLGDTLTTTSNRATVLVGSVDTISGVNPDTTKICWTPPVNPLSSYSVTFTSKDNNCPVKAVISQNIRIDIVDAINNVNITETKETCDGQNDGLWTASFDGGIGPFGYYWIRDGIDTLRVDSNVLTGVSSKNAYSVVVTDSFNMTSIQSVAKNLPATLPVRVVASTVNDIDCEGGCTGKVQITAMNGGNTSSPGVGGYFYRWNNSSDTTATADSLCAGTHLVTVTDDNGCDTVEQFFVSQKPVIDVAITDSSNISCKGGSDGTATGTANTIECGVYPSTATKCATANLSNVAIGNGATGNTFVGLPSPFVSSTNAKQQYLYLASELTAAGFTKGRISKVSFSLLGAFQSSFSDYTFAIGCTDSANLDNGFINGGFEVYSVGTHSFSVADLTSSEPEIVFNKEFVWDGTSNIVIQICNTKLATFNAQMRFTTTPHNSVAYFANDTLNACLSDTATTIVKTRPNIKFHFCDEGISYSWNSSPVQTDSAATGLPAGTYIVTASNLAGCEAKDTVTLTEPPVGLSLASTNINPIACAGDTNGSASIQVTVGSPAFTFVWPTGVITQVGNDSIATNLRGGVKYRVTVTDSKGCEDTLTVLLNEPNEITFGSSTQNNVACFGENTGSITVNPNGGTTPFSALYTWNPNVSATNTANNLAAGTYRVTATDASGCQNDTTFIITQPSDTMTFGTSVVNDVDCKGGSDGSITVNLLGGSTPHSSAFTWSPNVSTTNSAINLSAGTYSVTATDANGCPGDTTFTIGEPSDSVRFGGSTQTNVLCKGASTGSITVVLSGGTPPFSSTFTWSPNVSTTNSANGLAAGRYSVTASDANGCQNDTSFLITEPTDSTVFSSSTQTNVLCFGESTGSITVVPTGGALPYSAVYNWNPNVSTTNSANGLAAGNYSVTATDASGCQSDTTFTITQPTDSMTFGASIVTDVDCKGAITGQITVIPAGGTIPYASYTWSGGVSTNDTAKSLSAGRYTVTVTDDNGCQQDTTFLISEPTDTLTFGTSVVTNVGCKGASTGSITVNLTGGSTPYSTAFTWNPNVSTTNSATGLAAGTYSVTASDANGCQGDTTLTITEPATGVTFGSSFQTDVACKDSATGQIVVVPSGGTPPFSNFRWSAGGSTNDTAKTLTAGNYTVTVQDASGCDYDTTFTISEPSSTLSASFTNKVNPTCVGIGNNGSIQATVTGGTKPYTFTWVGTGNSTGPGDSLFTNMVAGPVQVTVRDAGGCEVTINDTLTSPSNISVSFTLTEEPTCFGDSTGTVFATIKGGTGPKTYSFIAKAGKVGSSDSIWTNTPADTITVNVEDSLGCKASAFVVLGQPDSMAINVQITQPVACAGDSTGSTRAIVTGGTRGYTYNWNGIGILGAADSLRDRVPMGTFQLNITDNNGCKDSVNYTMTGPAVPLAGTVVKDTVLCASNTNGTAYVIPSGGSPGYTYNWSAGNGGVNDDTSKFMPSGVFTVTITDNNSCTLELTDSIGSPDSLIGSFTNVITPGCGGSGLGEVTVTPTGGTPNGTSPFYSYIWIGGGINGTNDSIRTNIPPGTISVVISDANGCTSDTISITLTPPGNINPSFTLIQNPLCFNDTTGRLISTPTGGTAPFTFSWSHGNIGISDSDRVDLPAGVPIIVTVRDFGGCESKDTITLSNPLELRSEFTDSTSIQCAGGTNGSATVTPINGVSPFMFAWTTGVATQIGADSIAIGLSGNNTYDVTITDDNGCTVVDTIVLNEPNPLVLTFSDSIEVKCFNEPDGSITVTPSGGSGIYSFAWSASDGSTVNTSPTSDSVAINLIGNVTYKVTVTDAVGGCSDTASYTMDQPTDLRALVRGRGSATCGDDNGLIRIAVFGGVRNPTSPFYNVVWDSSGVIKGPGTGVGNIFTINNLYSGLYTFTATDANGCFMQDTVSVNDRGAPRLVLTGGPSGLVDATCNGVCNGEVNLTLVFSQAPVTYAWSNGDTTQDVDSLCVGQYNVTATDTNGCKAFYDFEIENTTNITASTTVDPLSCNATACDGTVRASGSSGNAPYSFEWSTSPTDILDSITNQCAGTYVVTVSDSRGCEAIDTAILLPPTSFTFATAFDSTTCNGGADGGARVTGTTGGSSPFSYQWSTGANDTLFAITGLTAGSYVVTVFEAGGCSVIDTVEVLQPDTISNTFVTTDADCGLSNGTVTATTSNGVAPYTYNWPNAGSTTVNTDNGYAAGSYSVLISDAKGCTINRSFNISNRNGPSITVDSVRDERCVASCDGAIFTTVSGGNSPYIYDWNPGNGSNDDTLNVCAGSYTLQVTDQKNCLSFQSATVDPGTLLLPNAVVLTNNTVKGACTGTAESNPTGGSGQYTYNWAPIGSTSRTLSGLCAGTYFLTVTDTVSGCTGLDTIVVTEPPAFTIDSLDIKNPTCGVIPCDGSVFIRVTGGVPPYRYLWDNGDTTQITMNRCAGNVRVTVSDASNSTPFSFVLSNPGAPTITTAKVDVTCNGAADGIGIGQLVSGGPVTWSWPTLSIANDTATGLAPGTYEVRATDTAGCVAVDTVTITQPDTLKNTFASVLPDCGVSNGSISSNISGGNNPYNIQWLDATQAPLVPTQTGVTLSSVASGLYHLSVTDDKGCTLLEPFTLNDKNAPIVTLDSVKHESCLNICDGGISVDVTGGAGNNNYVWSPGGSINEDLTSACAGTYTLEVTDAAGCKTTFQETINPGRSLNTTVTKISDASAVGVCDGQARVSVAGGATPLQFVWTSTETLDIATQLCGGKNYVTVTDANGCQAIDSVEILEPVTIILTQIDTTAPKCGQCDGKIKIYPSGGLAPYTFNWDNGDNTDSTINRCAGVKNVTVTDANLVSATFQIGLSSQNAPSLVMVENDVTCFGSCNGSATVRASLGTAPYNYVWPSIGSTDTTVTSLCKGVYLVEVRDSKGCISVDSANIEEPADILINVSTDSADCGQSNGRASVTAVGGSGSLSYRWSTGATGVTSITGLAAGAYSVTVEDANSCSKSLNFNISNPAGPTVVVDTVIDETCVGSCNGAIFITPSGTTGPYTFDWSPGGLTGEDVSNLCAGVYSVRVSDAAGCVTVVTDTVKSPTNLGTTITLISDASNYGLCDGRAAISIAKPGVYKFAWSSGDAGDTARMLCAGVNYVTITTATGCQYVDSIVVNQPQKMIIVNTEKSEPECNVCNGKVKITVTGGVPPYSFNWDNGDAADSTINRCAGVLFVTVTDSKNYAEIFSLGLNNSLAPKLSVQGTNAKCFDECSGSSSAFATGTLAPYNYTWPSLGKKGATVSNLCAGTYVVQVKDNVGCIATNSVDITEPREIDIDVSKNLSSCNAADGLIQVKANGGTPNANGYSYVWLDQIKIPIVPSRTGDLFINATAGLYHVVVTDDIGCADTIAITLDNKGRKVAIGLDSIRHVSCASECDGAIYTSISGNSTGTYSWIPGGQTTRVITAICAGDYTAVVTDTGGCKSVQLFTVNGPDPLDVVFASSKDVTCEYTNDGSIKALVASTQKLTIAWTGPQEFNANKLEVNNLLAGTYTVNVTDENNCVVTDSISLDTTFKFNVEAGADLNLCQGGTPQLLTATVTTNDFYSTFWYNENGEVLGKQDTVSVIPTVGAKDYIVEVRQDICLKSDTISIQQSDSLFAEAGDDVTITKGQSVELGGKPAAPDGAKVVWTPTESLSTGNVANPTGSPQETTTYYMAVGDLENCSVRDSVKVTITDRIEVNDGFSPNGDGVNDVWEISVLQDFPNAKVSIFNRWGQLLYESEPYLPWDGTFQGEPVSIGTYYYIIDLKDSSATESVISGPITIIR